ncbi:hypothetical protein WJX79_006203 [Trebouxia sp. C0005]
MYRVVAENTPHKLQIQSTRRCPSAFRFCLRTLTQRRSYCTSSLSSPQTAGPAHHLKITTGTLWGGYSLQCRGPIMGVKTSYCSF